MLCILYSALYSVSKSAAGWCCVLASPFLVVRHWNSDYLALRSGEKKECVSHALPLDTRQVSDRPGALRLMVAPEARELEVTESARAHSYLGSTQGNRTRKQKLILAGNELAVNGLAVTGVTVPSLLYLVSRVSEVQKVFSESAIIVIMRCCAVRPTYLRGLREGQPDFSTLKRLSSAL